MGCKISLDIQLVETETYRRRTLTSADLFAEAGKMIPGGVVGNARYFEPYPLYIKLGKGSRLYDVDGNEYIDFVCGYGPMLLGQAHPEVLRAIRERLEDGTHYNMSHELEVKMAKKICSLVPCAEMCRFTNTGTEAVLNALRLSRAYTGREKIAKFEGHYHGTHEYGMISVKYYPELAGSPTAPVAVPDSLGTLKAIVDNTVILPFNDITATEKIIKENRHELASVILEPVPRAAIPPDPEFLRALREVTEKYGIVLIFDEVITGFRLGLSGAQGYYGVIPDLVALGKIVGGGLPIGVFAGKREIMELVSPIGKELREQMYHSGTFNGCPVVLGAGLAAINILEREGTYVHLAMLGEKLRMGVSEISEELQIPLQVSGLASMFMFIFTDREIRNVRDVESGDRKKRHIFDLACINRGILFPPIHAGYISLAHSDEDINQTLSVSRDALKRVKELC